MNDTDQHKNKNGLFIYQQLAENTTNIKWIKSEIKTQTKLLYSLLIAIIGGLIGLFSIAI